MTPPRLTPQQRLLRDVPESDVLAEVLRACRAGGWRIFRVSDSRRQVGDRLVGDALAKGWPDVFAVRGVQQVAVECKTEVGKVTREQVEWLRALAGSGAAVFVARPSNAAEVSAWLRRRRGVSPG